MPLSSTNKSSATFVNALLALLPAGSGSDLCPANVIKVPNSTPTGAASGSTYRIEDIYIDVITVSNVTVYRLIEIAINSLGTE